MRGQAVFLGGRLRAAGGVEAVLDRGDGTGGLAAGEHVYVLLSFVTL